MKRVLPFVLAGASALLFFGAVHTSLSLLFLLFAYVPLLQAEGLLDRSTTHHAGIRDLLFGWFAFFLIDLLSLYPFGQLLSWWIAVYCVVLALSQGVVFALFAWVKRKRGAIWGYVAWVAFMTVWDYMSFHAAFSLPCLSAGTFAAYSGHTALLQWYEYTGILGGSVWVLTCNVLIFSLLKTFLTNHTFKVNTSLAITCLLLFIVPPAISLVIYTGYKTPQTETKEVVLVQPDIDPYTEKFNGDPQQQLRHMLTLARNRMTDETDYVVLPETALQGNLWYNNIEQNEVVRFIRDSLLSIVPTCRLIAGADMMQYYVSPNGQAPTRTAKRANEKVFYDFFNVAMQIGLHDSVQVYRKSKLVLGTEYVPLVQRFPQMEKWILNLGGSAQSRGRQESPSVLTSFHGQVAPVICFESLFGSYVSEFVRMGAEWICIISNDGWWDEHPIPWLHVRIAQLRAIENRRMTARCANTGISCLIDERGDLHYTTSWHETTAVNAPVRTNRELTFYTRHGDYIGKVAVVCSALLLLWTLARKKSN